MKQIIINSEELQVRVAVVEDGKLQDFFMERTNRDHLVGSIYKGKIKNLEPSLQAAFVDIGAGKNAFLHYWDMLPASQEVLEEGDEDDESKEEYSDDEDGADSTDVSHSDEVRREERKESGEGVESGTGAEDMSGPAAPILPGNTLHSRLHANLNHFDSVPHAHPQGVTQKLLPLTPGGQCGILPLGKAAQTPCGQEDRDDAAGKGNVVEVAMPENPAPEPFAESGNGSAGGRGGHSRHHHGHGKHHGASRHGAEENNNKPDRNANARNISGNGHANNGNPNAKATSQRGGNVPKNRGGQRNQPEKYASVESGGFFRRLCNALLPSWLGGGNAAPAGNKKPVPAKNNGGRKDAAKGQIIPLSTGKNAPSSQNQERQVNSPKGQLIPLAAKEKKNGSGDKTPRPQKNEKKGPSVEDIPNLFHVDQEILVQVTKGPIGTKGARVTTNLSIPGRNLVLLPNCSHVGISRRVEDREERSRLKQMIKTLDLPSNMGLICRTVGAGLKREHFQRDLDILLDAWHHGEELAASHHAPICIYQEPALEERVLRDCMTQDVDEIIVDTQEAYNRATQMIARFDKDSTVKVKLYTNPTPVFIKYGISQQIENISNRKVMLPSGGYLCIDETEALIAIDVNTGKNRSGKDQPETILETNMEAVKEIARQLRLRNIGGLVVLDLIDMRSKKDQMAVYRAFKQYVSEDHARIKVYPISGLGLLEMSRQRESESWQSTIFEDCPYCKGRGLIKTATSVSVEIQRRLNELMARHKEVRHFVITVHPKILDRLRTADHTVMDAMAAEHDRQLTFSGNLNLHIEEYHIADKETGKEF